MSRDGHSRDVRWAGTGTLSSSVSTASPSCTSRASDAQRIDGKNIYECADLPLDSKRAILGDLTAALRELHSLESAPADPLSTREAYYGKTVQRLKAVRDLIRSRIKRRSR